MKNNKKQLGDCRTMTDYSLREMNMDDCEFLYYLIKKNLKPDLTVTVYTLKPLDEFFKTYFENDLKTYIVMSNSERAGFVHITRSGEIGYYLLEKYQHKGIAINAIKEMLQKHPRDRYFATVSIKNERSNNLVKKLGFKPKGTIYELYMPQSD